MKRIAALILLAVMSFAGAATSARAQRISPEENARQSSRAARKQQKLLRKAAKKQRKAMKKFERQQRKAMRKANRHR